MTAGIREPGLQQDYNSGYHVMGKSRDIIARNWICAVDSNALHQLVEQLLRQGVQLDQQCGSVLQSPSFNLLSQAQNFILQPSNLTG